MKSTKSNLSWSVEDFDAYWNYYRNSLKYIMNFSSFGFPLIFD